jgi:uncharacterized protein
LPGFAAYVGSKQYLSGFTDTLRAELAGTGVVVTQVLPGPIATDFIAHSEPTTPIGPPAFVMLTADRCARIALAAFRRGRAFVVPGWIFGVVGWISRATPRWLLRIVASLLARWQRPRLRHGLTAPTRRR